MSNHNSRLRPTPSFPPIPRSGPGRRAFYEAFRATVADDMARRAADWRADGYSDAQIAEWLVGDVDALYISLRRDVVTQALTLAGAVAA